MVQADRVDRVVFLYKKQKKKNLLIFLLIITDNHMDKKNKIVSNFLSKKVLGPLGPLGPIL